MSAPYDYVHIINFSDWSLVGIIPNDSNNKNITPNSFDITYSTPVSLPSQENVDTDVVNLVDYNPKDNVLVGFSY